MTIIWEVVFRESYGAASIFDSVKVVARSAHEALKKAKPGLPKMVATDVRVVASAD